MVNYQISHGSGRMIYEEELRPPIRDFYSKQFNQIASEKGIEIESERLNPIRDRMVDEVIERIRKVFDKADPFSFKVDDLQFKCSYPPKTKEELEEALRQLMSDFQRAIEGRWSQWSDELHIKMRIEFGRYEITVIDWDDVLGQ